MKKRKHVFGYMVMTLILSLIITTNSCSKDEDVKKASYIGSWERTESSPFGETKQLLVLTTNTFNISMQMNLLNSWLNIMLIKGTMIENGDLFSLTVTEIGIPNDDFSEIVFFTSEDEEWNDLLEDEAEIEEQFDVKIKVTQNKLTIISDDNHDNTFDEELEGDTFTRL